MPGVILYSLLLVAAALLALPVRTRAVCAGDGWEVYRGSRQRIVNRLCFAGLFLLLFLPSALRFGTGNDYLTYIVRFHDVYTDNVIVTEPGFNLLVDAIYHFLHEEYYLVIFAVFAALTVYIFLAALYEQSRDYALSVYLFLALGLYFQSYNTVRYYLALGILLYAMRPTIQRQYWKFVVLTLLAALFHKTALAALVLYPLACLPWKKWMALPAAVAAASGLLLKDQYLALFLRLYPSYVNEPEYLSGGGISYANIARCALVLALCAYLYRGGLPGRRSLRFYIKLNALALVLYSCFSFVPFLSRIGYYLTVSQLLLLPSALADAGERERRYLRWMVIAAGALYFVFFLRAAAGEYVQILPYATWMNKTSDWTSYHYIRFVP